MNYRPTQVNVVRTHQIDDVVATELRLAEARWPSPLAPATLWDDEEGDASSSLRELHHLNLAGDEFAEFESYEAPNMKLNRPGPYARRATNGLPTRFGPTPITTRVSSLQVRTGIRCLLARWLALGEQAVWSICDERLRGDLRAGRRWSLGCVPP